MGAWVPRECSRAFYNFTQSAHSNPQHTVNDWPVFCQLEVIILGGLVWLAGCSIMRLVSHLSDSDRCETKRLIGFGLKS